MNALIGAFRHASLGLLLLSSLACARIYRSVEVASARPTARGELAGVLVSQAWGDNSRYEDKARAAGLRVLSLGLENASMGPVELLRLETPEGVALRSPGEAADRVKLAVLPYLLYPLIPALLSTGSSGGAGYMGPSPAMIFGAVALVGAAVGLSNLGVAIASNARLEAFFQGQAWKPGRLNPGQSRRGLVFLQSEGAEPTRVTLIYRAEGAERSLELWVPPPGSL